MANAKDPGGSADGAEAACKGGHPDAS
jgi:hypothetical protein